MVSTSHRKQPITVIDQQGKVVKKFGTWLFPSQDIMVRRARNDRLLVYDERRGLIAIGDSVPLLEIYDGEGEVIRTHQLRAGYRLEARIAESEKKYEDPANKAVTVVIFTDAEIAGDRLYLTQVQEGGTSTCLLVMQFLEDDLVLEREVILETGIDGDADFDITPMVSDEKGSLFAYDRRMNRIYRYSF